MGRVGVDINAMNHKTFTITQRLTRCAAFLLRLDNAVERQAQRDERRRAIVRNAVTRWEAEQRRRRWEIYRKTGRMVQQ